MGRELTPDERRELLGAYALGALDDAEHEQVQALVLEDATARAELHRLQLGVAWLDHASTGAPMHVWREIAREIAPEVHEQGDPGEQGDRAETPAPVPSVVDLDARRRRVMPARVLAVAAALVVALVVGLGVLVAGDDGGPSGEPTVAALAARAAQRPGTDTVPLRAADGTAAGSVVVGTDGRAYLVWRDRPPVASGSRTYQLWELTPDGPRSAGLLGGEAADRAFPVGPTTSGVAVTLEPRGGSPAPTGVPVVTADLA